MFVCVHVCVCACVCVCVCVCVCMYERERENVPDTHAIGIYQNLDRPQGPNLNWEIMEGPLSF